MRNILVITHLEQDEQLELVRSKTRRGQCNFLTLSTNSGKKLDFGLQINGSVANVVIDGEILVPDAIWFATHPRTDSLYSQEFRFPGEHRSAVAQLIIDLHYMFRSGVSWFPSSLDLVGQADSKPFLLREALYCGLKTPQYTLNANLRTKKKITIEKLYKKKLGFPSVISFDRESNQEVIVTTTNKLGDIAAGREVWQWQSPIKSLAHIRCCVVGTKIWASMWRRRSVGKIYDYRSQVKDDAWEPYILPEDVEMSLTKLMGRLGLKIACPEFLVEENGSHVFIDMNPCGDWSGFFDDASNHEIAQSIYDLLQFEY